MQTPVPSPRSAGKPDGCAETAGVSGPQEKSSGRPPARAYLCECADEP